MGSLSSPGDLPNPGIEPGSPALQVGSLKSSKRDIIKHKENTPICLKGYLQYLIMKRKRMEKILIAW